MVTAWIGVNNRQLNLAGPGVTKLTLNYTSITTPAITTGGINNNYLAWTGTDAARSLNVASLIAGLFDNC